ncbi:MAG: HAD hydrolase family protein, partial [Verrucomicrobiota bacterium]
PLKWIINTGRDWESLRDELIRREAQLFPDWVVLIEREIHRVHQQTLEELPEWNQGCSSAHSELFAKAQSTLDKIRDSLSPYKTLQMVRDVGSPLGLIAENNAQADEVDTIIAPLVSEIPEMQVVRNDIYFRFAHVNYHKGSCLQQICKEEGVGPELCFTAGDNINDLAMLERKYAHFLACPSNSLPEVKAKVRDQGGFVADQPADLGILQALKHFFGD